MSTIDRADPPRSRAARGPYTLAARAIRTRNACVRHAAERLGLPAPDDDDLRALPGDASLRDAVEWWRARAPGAVLAPTVAPPRRLVLKTALITTVTLLGLALSYVPAQ